MPTVPQQKERHTADPSRDQRCPTLGQDQSDQRDRYRHDLEQLRQISTVAAGVDRHDDEARQHACLVRMAAEAGHTAADRSVPKQHVRDRGDGEIEDNRQTEEDRLNLDQPVEQHRQAALFRESEENQENRQ